MDKLFYTIDEVSKMLDLPKSTIRYWEKKFRRLTPVRTQGNRRLYRKQDIELLKRIKFYVHVQGYSLEYAGKLLENKVKGETIDLLKELLELKRILEE